MPLSQKYRLVVAIANNFVPDVKQCPLVEMSLKIATYILFSSLDSHVLGLFWSKTYRNKQGTLHLTWKKEKKKIM